MILVFRNAKENKILSTKLTKEATNDYVTSYNVIMIHKILVSIKYKFFSESEMNNHKATK